MESSQHVKCGLINIQSVGNKTIKIRNLINEIELDLCLLTETWLQGNISDNSKIKEMTPCTHDFYHVPRKDKIGGGVGVLVSKTFTNVSIKNEITFETFEYIYLQLTRNSKVLKIISLYRPPRSNMKKFIEEFNILVDMVDDIQNTFIGGDFNCWVEDDNDNKAKELKEVFEIFNLINNVSVSTSVGGHTLDLVISGRDSNLIRNLEVEPDFEISKTHKLITFDVNINCTRALKKWITYREKRNFDAENFIEVSVADMSCENIQCEHMVDGTCVGCYTKTYNNSFGKTYDTMCPMKRKQIVVHENVKWFNSELLKAKRLRRKMENRWRRAKSAQARASYNKARNDYNTLIEKTKRKFYNNESQKTNNMRKFHKTLDDLLGLKKEIVLPENVCVENFARFFDEKIDKIYRGFPQDQLEGRSVMPVNDGRKLNKFKEINTSDLLKVMREMKNTYCKNDPFPNDMISEASNRQVVYNIYLKIINLSISQSCFPSCEKTALVKPIYKGKGDVNELNSYRPISNLSYMSKLIEKIISEQLWAHISELEVFPENQSAYRANHSTETTLCSIMNDMIGLLDEGGCGILIMLDLSAAFDTVVHKYLLKDLQSIGVIEDALEFLRSYLENRKTIVEVSGNKSNERILMKGVPQGSVLGPILFNIYTIELSYILEKHNVGFKLYADDTQFYFSISTTQDTMKKVDEIMTEIKAWMQKKKLKLNDDKTECMLFGTMATLKNYQLFQSIKIGDADIRIVPLVKNLGVLIDCNLTMRNHIVNTVKVCNYHLRNIAFIRKYLTESSTKILVMSHVISRLDYCNSLCYKLPNTLLRKLQNVQNRAARLIKGIKIRERITPALIDLHWLPIKARIEFKICLLTYKALTSDKPKYLRDCLVPYPQATSATVRIRHADDPHRLFESSVNHTIGGRTFRYAAPRLFNDLPLEVKNSSNVAAFKKNLKTYLFGKCYNSDLKTIIPEYKC